jgi:hypothetical protein
MPIFNNAAIAASFKAPPNPNPKDANNPGSNKKNRNGIGIEKTELVKQDMPTGATVLRLVLLSKLSKRYWTFWKIRKRD